MKAVNRSHIREVLDNNPSIEAVVQGGGSPCQGLSKLSSGRKHFEDDRSVLLYDLVRVMRDVRQEAEARLMKHFGFIENVVCDEVDQLFQGCDGLAPVADLLRDTESCSQTAILLDL